MDVSRVSWTSQWEVANDSWRSSRMFSKTFNWLHQRLITTPREGRWKRRHGIGGEPWPCHPNRPQLNTFSMLTVTLSLFGFLLLQLPLAWFILHVYSSRLRFTNRTRRSTLLTEMNFTEDDKMRIVGFFHPYWWIPFRVPFLFTLSDAVKFWSNAGGGGERVLWTAIAALQRTDPDVLSVIYTGDIDASKGQIIDKVKVNCSYYQSLNLE